MSQNLTYPPADARRPSTPLLMANMTAGLLAMMIITPALPAIGQEFAADRPSVQQVMTIYIITFAAAQLLAGPLSDLYGRRRVMLWGFVLFTFGSAACAAAPSLPILVAGRALQAFGACAGLVVTRAIISDVYPDRGQAARIMGYASMAMGCAPAFGPLIGGELVAAFGWRSVFVVMSVYGAIITFASLARLHETARRSSAADRGVGWVFRSYASVVKSPFFIAYALCMAFPAMSFFAFMTSAPYILIERLGLGADEFGRVALLFSVGFIVGSYITKSVTMRIGPDRMMLWGSVFICVATGVMLGFAVAGIFTVWAIVVPVFFVGVGHGFVSPNALAGAVSSRREIAGAAAALAGFVHTSGGSLASEIMGEFTYETQMPTVVAMSIFAAGNLIAAMYVMRLRRRV